MTTTETTPALPTSTTVAAPVDAAAHALSTFRADRLRTVHNGAKAPLTFSTGEFERRLAGLREAMTQLGVDAVVLTSMQAIKYYSDFLYTSFGRGYALVVTHETSTTVSAGIDAGMPWRRSHGDNVVYTDWERTNPEHAVATLLETAHVARGVIGFEYDHLTLHRRDQFAAALPGARMIDIGQAVMRQRMIKSAEEIALITEAARIADLGAAAIRDALDGMPAGGSSEYEIALAGTEEMVRRIASSFPDSELRDTWVWFQSGLNTDGAHNWPTTRRVQPGDLLSLNCFPMVSGYYVALERTMFYGEPDDATLALWESLVTVHERGLELIRPGARCRDIADELNGLMAELGILPLRTFGYGHSFGVLSHYYGREAGLELREDIDTVLEPGMVVSMEPMITVLDGNPGAGGYREHDILVITADGATNITGYPYGPAHNIVPARH